jgi:CHAT domain-containing protein
LAINSSVPGVGPSVDVKYDQGIEIMFQPGIQLSSSTLSDESRLAPAAIRSARDVSNEIVAKNQLSLHGGNLASLPGTGREAEAIATTIRSAGGSVTILLREKATLAELESHISGQRFLHLATHGLTGSSRYPLEASLALTPPASPSLDDVGFLTLGRILQSWRGKLDGCELVVLSACDTQRGVIRGDSHITLPWGFMFAGAPSVLASLWKVDDVAVVLLMSRFYENIPGEYEESRSDLLPRTKMSKIQGLSEAKEWLKRLSMSDVAIELTKLGMPAARDFFGATHIDSNRGEICDERPGPPVVRVNDKYDFSHPYYWAGFVLIGNPD